MPIISKFIATIIIIFINLSALAIDLQEAITSAYNNNDELKVIRRDFLDEIEQFPQALSRFLPNIIASIDASDAKSKNIGQFGNSPTERKTLQNNIIIEQPIFNGGGDVALLKVAQSTFKASRGKYYASEQKILLSTIQSYLDYVEAREKYEISESSVRSNQKQLEAVEERLKVGESTETELASARAGLALAETNKLTEYANLQSAKANFAKKSGLTPADDITMPPVPIGLPGTFDELSKRSLAANPEIDYIRHSVNASKTNEIAAKSALLPQVSFKVQTGKTYYDPETQNFLGSGTTNSRSVTSSLSLQIPIYSRGGVEYSKIRKAKNSTRKIVHQLDDQLKQNNSNCITSWEGFNAAKSKIIAATQGVDAAQIAYDGTVEEEKVGSKSILDVLNAEDRLNKAKIQKVGAYKEHILAAYQMKSLIGQLTAKSLKLNVTYFIPEQEFKKVKMKIIGF